MERVELLELVVLLLFECWFFMSISSLIKAILENSQGEFYLLKHGLLLHNSSS